MDKDYNEGYHGNANSEERRIVLVGKTGVGKSAAGNTILGREVFESKASACSLTTECKKAKGNVHGWRVAVIDTPGLFDTKLTQEGVIERIKTCICLSSPGSHAFLVVLRVGRFTQEEKETVKIIQTTFGKDSARYTMVLFTHGDQLENQTMEDFMAGSPDLKAFISSCSNRYHVFNNKNKDREQTKEMLDKIDKMIMENGGSFYTNMMFKKAEEAIEVETKRLLMGYWWKKLSILNSRARAERSNTFISASMLIFVRDTTGATMGGALGGAVGAVIGIAGGPIGVAVGGSVGSAVGAAAGAIYVRVSDQCQIQ